MTTARCDLGFDADDVLEAVREGDAAARAHVEGCDACRRIVRVHARARSAWRAAIQHDDIATAAESELRLQRPWPRPPERRRFVFALGAALGACAATLAFFLFLPERPPPPAAPTAATAPAPSPPPPHDIADAAPRTARSVVVAASACLECRLDGATLEPGTKLEGKRVEVPKGAHLTLGFSLPDGLVDPKSGADVRGPASARIDADAITIERGVARVRAAKDVTVIVPGARVSGADATFTIRVDDRGATRLDVEHGKVVVASDKGSLVQVAPGTSFDVAPAEGTKQAESAPAPIPAPTTPSAPPVVSAEPAEPPPAHAIDADARSELERIAGSSDQRAARRASFTLAELDLATGEKARARQRLEALAQGPDAALAYDATVLLARSYPTAAERAAAWARYLATAPSSPYFERALLAHADALLDAGEKARAQQILDELERTAQLGEPEKRLLRRLQLKVR